MDRSEAMKTRDIGFRGPHHQGNQASGACALVVHLNGVQRAEVKTAACLQVDYDLHCICLRVLRRHLQLAGFHLDASLLTKLKTALIEYAEEHQREEWGLGDCAMPNQAFRPTAEQLSQCDRFIRPPSPPERSDDPWRHYL